MSETATPDVLDALAGLAAESPVAALRRQRPDVVRFTQASDEAIFAPTDDGGLTRAERAAAALRIAALLHDPILQDHYQALLEPLDEDGNLLRSADVEAQTGDARWATVIAHIDRVTADPDSATKAHIDGLLAAGLSPHAVVSLSQVIAYVNFQARVLAGLRMLRDAK
jgi:CMD domain protein